MTHDTRTAALDILRAQRDAENHLTLSAEALARGRRRTVELARWHGLSWADIGSILGCSANTARMRYERGL